MMRSLRCWMLVGKASANPICAQMAGGATQNTCSSVRFSKVRSEICSEAVDFEAMNCSASE